MHDQHTGRKALSEHASKQMLKKYGVPVVAEQVVHKAGEAASMAEQMGFPVVVKGLGEHLLHKTEAGLVHLNLQTPAAVDIACSAIRESAGEHLEGFLVQPYLQGRREFVAGLFYDRMFGAVVMFGLGGIFTEALADVSFRIAPLTPADAHEMIDEIKSRKLLGAFRGEKAADRQQLIDTLMGLSALGTNETNVSEVDINPLIVTPDGKVCAVDALVVKCDDNCSDKTAYDPVDPQRLGRLFYPRSIAFIGASGRIGKWGHSLLTNTMSSGYEGDVYLVNPKRDIIAGLPVYHSVTDIPGEVDLAVVTVPAALVSDLIPDLKAKNIKNMVLITSGFRETGEEGRQLEEALVCKAKEAGILMVGPNTMGICNPHIKLYCTGNHVWPAPGGISMIAQSGNMGSQLLHFAEQQGIEIRAFSGSGNEAMVTIEDYLEAFEVDELTDIVMLYVESVKNGRRFLESARRVSMKKPIVLLKGGQTEEGQKAAASHTGAMTSNVRVFDAVCKQSGIIKVNHPTDMLDLSAAFSSLPLPKGNRIGIMTLGGGWGVVASDLCASYNLKIPALSDALMARCDALLPPYWSRTNPVDLVGENDNSLFLKVLEELMKWDGCDAVLNLGILGRRLMTKRVAKSAMIDPTYKREFLDQVIEAMYDFEKKYIRHVVDLMDKYHKPIIGVNIMTDETEDKTLYKMEGSDYKGVFFPTPERAVKALAKMYDYRRFLER